MPPAEGPVVTATVVVAVFRSVTHFPEAFMNKSVSTKQPATKVSDPDTDTTVIFTDGGAHPNPGRGGWGVVLLRPGSEPEELCGGEADSTNNRCELLAAIKGLAELEDGSRVTVYTDSQYVKNGITEWMAGWKRREWKTAANKDVKNRDLWEELDEEVARHHVTWRWVRGHTGDVWNERADQLATRGRG